MFVKMCNALMEEESIGFQAAEKRASQRLDRIIILSPERNYGARRQMSSRLALEGAQKGFVSGAKLVPACVGSEPKREELPKPSSASSLVYSRFE